jgi:cold shock CspA family protein
VRTGPGQKGPQVTEIISVDASAASQEPPRRPRPERPGHSSGDRATVEELCTVKWYNADKGFGFVAPDQGGKDIFVHASVLERAGIMGLAEGQRVAIEVAQGQKGPERLACGSSENACEAVSYEAARRASRFAPCGTVPNLSLYQLAALTIGARLAVADA